MISCKKDNPLPPPEPVVDYQLIHSGLIDGVPYSLDTNSTSPIIFKSYIIDDFLYRWVNVRVWTAGDKFDVDSVATDAYAFNIEVVVQYSYSELDNDGEMPELTASKLAAAINNGDFEWNDDEEMKMLSMFVHHGEYWTGMYGGNDFVITNPQVHATAIGTQSIQITGSVDSLMIDNTPMFANNINFNYTIPVPQ